MTQIDIDHLRGWIGRTEEASELVTSALVTRFNATLDRPGDPTHDNEAPTMLHWCLAQPSAPTSALGADGHPARGGFLPPVPLPRRMWAGGELTFEGNLRIGEEMKRRSTIADVALKEGRTGPLCFVTVDHRILSGDRPVLRERQDIVYREAEGPKLAAPAPPAAPKGRRTNRIMPSAPLLFRYSALTFNGHRIHYDTPWAREVEGYPGLVVHGPLQATLLAHHAEAIFGRPLKRFRFRSLSPLFDTEDFWLHAEPEGAALRLWTAREEGPLAMEAHAEC